MGKKLNQKKEGAKSSLQSTILILILLFLGGIFFIKGPIELREIRFVYTTMACFIGLGVYLWFVHWSAGAFIFYLSFLILIRPMFIESFYNLFIFALIYLYMVIKYDEWKEYKSYVYDGICFIALACFIFQVIQIFGFYPFAKPTTPENYALYPGLMANPNDTSVFMAVCLPAFLRKKRYVFIFIPIAGLIIAKALVGVFSVALMLLCYILFSQFKRKYIYMVLVLIIGISFVLYKGGLSLDTHKNYRLKAWNYTYEMALMRPFGWGMGQYKYIFPFATSFSWLTPEQRGSYFPYIWDKEKVAESMTLLNKTHPGFFQRENQLAEAFLEAHNEPIQLWFEIGIIGTFLMLYLYFVHFLNGLFSFDRTPFYGLMVAGLSSLVFFSFHIAPIAIVTLIYAASIQGERYGNKHIIFV